MADKFSIRQDLNQQDVDEVYAMYPTLFSLRLHHGGEFTPYPGCRYINGKIDYIDVLDTHTFSVSDLDAGLVMLGYENGSVIYYHYLIADHDLDSGLRALACDNDVLEFNQYMSDHNHKLINVYTKHGRTNIGNGCRGSRILQLEWMQVAQQEDVSILDYDENNSDVDVVVDASKVAENIDVRDDNDQTDKGAHVGENVDIGVDVDENLHDGADVDPFENVDDGADSDDDDSDYIVDNDNIMDDPEVDMREFRLNIDLDVEDTNTGDHTDVEDDVLDNEVFESGCESDENAASIRIQSLKHLRRSNENSKNFYLGQMFGTKEETKKLIRKHAVETRRVIKSVKDDTERVRAVCLGDLPSFEILEGGSQKVKGAEMVKGKEKGAEKGKAKEKGAEKVKGKEAGQDCSSSKDKGPDKNVGGRGNKTNPHQYQCPWTLLASKDAGSETWIVRTLVEVHTCIQNRNIYVCTSTFLSQEMLEQVEENPDIPVKAVQEQFQRKYALQISKMKAYRAKIKAKKQVHGDYKLQYPLLRDYANELLKTNPGSTVKIEVEPVRNENDKYRVFKRIYVCLGALKQGFKAIGRDMLGLDGAFMKGPFPGQILSAVAVDPNNGIYPVAYAVVEAENLSSWTWFLECVADDLDLNTNSNFTFVSDRQKGILTAIENLFPLAEHRFCLKHIHENMKLSFKGKLYRDMLWKIATSTTVVHFQEAMDKLKEFNTDAHSWLSKIQPQHWTRSHFSGRAVSDVLLNNMCEVFNGKIVDAKDKPIITALEFIREYLMRRIVTILKKQEKCEGLFTPYATTALETLKKDATFYTVMWNGDDQYQVSGPKGSQYVVHMGRKFCTCRRREITGIPCKHAVETIWYMASNGNRVGILESWVHPVYKMDTWRQVYSFKVNPTNGSSMWQKTQIPSIIKPPRHHKQVGRPKKARRKSAVEMEDITKGGRLSKKGTIKKCGNCKEKGHNRRSCTKAKSDGGAREKGSINKSGAGEKRKPSADDKGVAAEKGKGISTKKGKKGD